MEYERSRRLIQQDGMWEVPADSSRGMKVWGLTIERGRLTTTHLFTRDLVCRTQIEIEKIIAGEYPSAYEFQRVDFTYLPEGFDEDLIIVNINSNDSGQIAVHRFLKMKRLIPAGTPVLLPGVITKTKKWKIHLQCFQRMAGYSELRIGMCRLVRSNGQPTFRTR
ncbi:MAG: hypothetical protein R3C03_10780 [Pirellulaceae bacterium]